ncbi:MAG: DUF1015 domain-containing protein [Christensenellaceae bacterium]
MNILKVPQILLPKKNVDLKKWSVIACDQFTSDKTYWKTLEDCCGDVSTLRIIYPEIYLNDNTEERIKNVNAKMREYLEQGIFEAYNGFILTVRTTSYGNKRIGLIVSFDLEQYEIGKKLAVRATEATVKERLPIRVKIRENAEIELPHALVLIDDEQKSVIEPIYKDRDKLKKLYSTDLNMDGGHIEGYLVEDAETVVKALDKLTSYENCLRKYNGGEPFVFAVGDGNHSIATARACWDKIKQNLTEEERENHPARYCLVEVNNIYGDDLKFKPIHRAVFNVGEDFIRYLINNLSGSQQIQLFYKNMQYCAQVDCNSAKAISDIQRLIDSYIDNHPGVTQDYIHGDAECKALSVDGSAVSVMMPRLNKADLFPYVAKFGTLTRKSFSMGEAKEKRYYFECKKIR